MQPLSPPEIRVLGALIEKQLATPAAYPLTLNALRLACNQTTSREPVVDYDEETVHAAALSLSRRRLARLASAGRVQKYRHLLSEELKLSREETAVLAALMLRGPQTPAELKARTERLHQFDGQAEVDAVIDRLAECRLAARLERRPGQKGHRCMHLLGEQEDEPEGATVADSPADRPAPAAGDGLSSRVERLEGEVRALRQDLAALRAELE